MAELAGSEAHASEPDPAVASLARIVAFLERARTRAAELDGQPGESSSATVLVFDLDIALSRARALTATRDSDEVLALTRDLDRALDIDFDVTCARRQDMVRAIHSAQALCEDLAVTLAGAPHASLTMTTTAEPGRLSLGMTRLAVRALPATQRGRYDQEFRAELAELAERSSLAALTYALRLLTRCWQLRRALIDGATTAERGR